MLLLLVVLAKVCGSGGGGARSGLVTLVVVHADLVHSVHGELLHFIVTSCGRILSHYFSCFLFCFCFVFFRIRLGVVSRGG